MNIVGRWLDVQTGKEYPVVKANAKWREDGDCVHILFDDRNERYELDKYPPIGDKMEGTYLLALDFMSHTYAPLATGDRITKMVPVPVAAAKLSDYGHGAPLPLDSLTRQRFTHIAYVR